MNLTVGLPVGVVAAILTATEFLLSTIAALSARATLHGFWLMGLHRGGEAALDARARTRRALRKDFFSFGLTIFLVMATAGVESNLEPTYILEPFAVNSSSCVSMYGRVHPGRVQAHSPPFKVTVEPWVIETAKMLKCTKGIASLGVNSWTHVSGQKMDLRAPTCVNKSIDLSTEPVGAELRAYKFQSSSFNPPIGMSPSYILFPLQGKNIGKDIRQIGTARKHEGACRKRGISAYFMGMNAKYETSNMRTQNMTFGIHEGMCSKHGSKRVNALNSREVQRCLVRQKNILNVTCFRDSASSEQRYSIRLPDMAALYVSDKIDSPSYACVHSTVQIDYVFITPELARNFLPRGQEGDEQLNHSQVSNPTRPILVPISVNTVTGTCERTLAPIAQSALLFSVEQEWFHLAFAELDRQVRFHAFMMAVSDSLFPLPRLPKPESSMDNGTCYTRPCCEVTQIPWSWAAILLLVGLILSVVTITLAFLFRLMFRGESWLVGSARWSIARLLDGERNENKRSVEASVEAVHIAQDPDPSEQSEMSATSYGWARRSIGATEKDWKYEFRIR